MLNVPPDEVLRGLGAHIHLEGALRHEFGYRAESVPLQEALRALWRSLRLSVFPGMAWTTGTRHRNGRRATTHQGHPGAG